nr:putative heat shock protein 70 family, peptide-binding domain protein [Tanacetum cinerariifolium]
MSQRTAIGIDLGTTYSCVAAWLDQHDRVEIIPNEQGYNITPLCVAFDETEVTVGEGAKDQIYKNPTNTIFGVKRLMGSRFSDSTVKKYINSWPFKVIEGSIEKPLIVVKHKYEEEKYSPEEISCMILKNMKEATEAFHGTKVTDAVITVPACFNSEKVKMKKANSAAEVEVAQLKAQPISTTEQLSEVMSSVDGTVVELPDNLCQMPQKPESLITSVTALCSKVDALEQ